MVLVTTGLDEVVVAHGVVVTAVVEVDVGAGLVGTAIVMTQPQTSV